MLNGRIYRAAFLPLLLALAIAGFSLADRPAPLGSNLAPDAFDGARVVAELNSLSARFPDPRPGGPGDRELAAYVAAQLRAFGDTAGGGFTVKTHTVTAPTIAGRRTLTTVLAQRPGSTSEPPIAIVAHRDAAPAPARGELSATALLLELARVFAASQTRRSILLVSTSGGSGGNAGAADFATHAAQWAGGPIDAALVLGDLAGTRPLLVAPFSTTPGSAPQLLQRTVAQALRQQAAVNARAPTLLDTLAQLSFPLTAGEQGPLDASGLPAVLLGAGGELPPAPRAPLSDSRLEGVGRAVLAAVYALDAGPEVSGVETALPIERKLLPEWAVRLLVAALLLPPLLTAGDGLARMRRRRRNPIERPLARSIAWVAACGLPFLACALFAMLLGLLGVFPAPRPPVAPVAAPLAGSALEAVLAVALVFVLSLLTWPMLMRRLGLPPRPDTDAAGLALVLLLGALAVVVWIIDPFTALLLVPALHLWLALADPERPVSSSSWLTSLGLLVLGVAPLGLLIAFYAVHLGLGPGGVAHTAVLLLAGGRIGLVGAVLWSLALGTALAALRLVIASPRERLAGPPDPGEELPERETFATRGPMSYAGPGSLGGTESALRR
ncbi:MAG TPA: M28 family peptidase [Solirubrobacteraceae bacterium]